MYGRIVELQLDGTSLAQGLRQRLSRDLLPELSKQPGFVAYYMIESDDACLVTVRVFDSLETLEHASMATRPIHEAIVADLDIGADRTRSVSGPAWSWIETPRIP